MSNTCKNCQWWDRGAEERGSGFGLGVHWGECLKMARIYSGSWMDLQDPNAPIEYEHEWKDGSKPQPIQEPARDRFVFITTTGEEQVATGEDFSCVQWEAKS